MVASKRNPLENKFDAGNFFKPVVYDSNEAIAFLKNICGPFGLEIRKLEEKDLHYNLGVKQGDANLYEEKLNNIVPANPAVRKKLSFEEKARLKTKDLREYTLFNITIPNCKADIEFLKKAGGQYQRYLDEKKMQISLAFL